MENYKVIKKMATALYGDVLLCNTIESNQSVAIKRMDKKCAKSRKTQRGNVAVHENAAQEIQVNQTLSANGGHRHVLKMQKSFEEQGTMHCVFDYCDYGELFSYVQEKGALSEKEALKYIAQILQGVYYMHQMGFAHRDLSLENVLLDKKLNCQVCDFGLATPIGELYATLRTQIVGKPLYMAPEIIARSGYDPTKIDVWSIGIILFIMLTGAPAFAEASMRDKAFRIASRHGLRKLMQMWKLESTMSEDALDLLCGLLAVDPDQRISMHDALHHKALDGLVQDAVEMNDMATPECRSNESPTISSSFAEIMSSALSPPQSKTMNIRAPEMCDLKKAINAISPRTIRKSIVRSGPKMARILQYIKRQGRSRDPSPKANVEFSIQAETVSF